MEPFACEEFQELKGRAAPPPRDVSPLWEVLVKLCLAGQFAHDDDWHPERIGDAERACDHAALAYLVEHQDQGTRGARLTKAGETRLRVAVEVTGKAGHSGVGG